MMQVPMLRDPSELISSGSVFIYGTGTAGRWMKGALVACEGVHVAGFVDSRQAGFCENLPVILPQDLRQQSPGSYTVVIASMHVSEIVQTLQTLQTDNITAVFNGYPYYCRVSAGLKMESSVRTMPENERHISEFLLRECRGQRIAIVGDFQSAANLVATLRGCPEAPLLVAHYDDIHAVNDGFNKQRFWIHADWIKGHTFEKIVLFFPEEGDSKNLYREKHQAFIYKH